MVDTEEIHSQCWIKSRTHDAKEMLFVASIVGLLNVGLLTTSYPNYQSC